MCVCVNRAGGRGRSFVALPSPCVACVIYRFASHFNEENLGNRSCGVWVQNFKWKLYKISMLYGPGLKNNKLGSWIPVVLKLRARAQSVGVSSIFLLRSLGFAGRRRTKLFRFFNLHVLRPKIFFWLWCDYFITKMSSDTLLRCYNKGCGKEFYCEENTEGKLNWRMWQSARTGSTKFLTNFLTYCTKYDLTGTWSFL